nr:PcfJ domain-containing protein [uncultured Duncaniella sp.]
MKPKTKLQKEVARLSATLSPISDAQLEWAYKHCFEHIAYRTKNGTMTCSDCGHVWHSKSTLADTLCGCRCPICGAELKVQETRRRTLNQTRYFSVITTCKGFQVIRVSQVKYVSRKGEPMQFYCHEVVQRWISSNGKVTDMALLRGFPFYYCDVWALDSDMEVRPHNSLYDEVVAWGDVYPRMSILPQLKRNGFKGDFHGVSPVRLFKALLSDQRIETLMKAGEIEEMKYFLSNRTTADNLWASYLIAKRHHYQINNIGMWCDYLMMLKILGKDIRNPKNICPQDFIEAHDRVHRLIDAKREKARAERERQYEIERREREQQRLLKEKENEDRFIALKSKFFGLVITDNELTIKVLESIDEYYEEGTKQDICVFGAGYYHKEDTLILSARIGGEIIETVEVDLHTFKVVQCHGKYNKDTKYHDRIIDLVNSNAKLIRKRMTA